MKNYITLLLTLIITFSFTSCKKDNISLNSSGLNIKENSIDTSVSNISGISDNSNSSSDQSTSKDTTTSITSSIASNSTKPSNTSSADSSASSNKNNSIKPNSSVNSDSSSVPVSTESSVSSNPDTYEKPENLYILGDSYSTFEGCIPDGYPTWYINGGNGVNNVTNKNQTWWYYLINNHNLTIMKNNSYSATTICNTSYGGSYCPTTSFVGRFDEEIKNGTFKKNTPDKMIIFGGTNDSWANSPIGEIKWSDFSDNDLKNVLPAFCYLILRVKENLPDTEIIMIINSELKEEITLGFEKICSNQNIKYVTLNGIEKQSGHPTQKGMHQIYIQIRNAIYK